MLTFTKAGPHRYEARPPVDWALGFRPWVPQTRSFAVIRRAGAGFLLYVHDKGVERRPVEFDALADAQEAASLVAEMSTQDFARLRTISGTHIARNFGIAHPSAQRLAQGMRSAMVAKYTLRHNLVRTVCDRSVLPVAPRAPRMAWCR